MDPFADFGIEPQNVIMGYVSGAISTLIVPIQLIVLSALYSHKELWNNSSYRLLFRLILLEVFQSTALILTAVFTVYPYLVYVDVLRKACSVVLSTFFLMNFVFMYELSILRILVVCKKCMPDKLPLPILFFEIFCLLIVLGFSIPAYINESMSFGGGDWYYNDDDIYALIIDKAEVYFCIPLLLVTYCAYLILIAMIYGKRKRFSENSSSKHEWLLFLQATFVTVYYIFLIYDWHFIDTPVNHKIIGYSLEVFSAVMWGTAYYWNSLLLLVYNQTVRNSIFSRKKKVAVIVSTR